MVAKRQRRTYYRTEAEAARAALAKVPTSDEDPTLFWGPDFYERLRQAEEDIAAGRTEIFYSTEEFFAALDSIANQNKNQ